VWRGFVNLLQFKPQVDVLNTVKSVLSGHPKISGRIRQMAVNRIDCFNMECTAEGQKQNGRITQMAVKSR
jgi:hypothetical protein